MTYAIPQAVVSTFYPFSRGSDINKESSSAYQEPVTAAISFLHVIALLTRGNNRRFAIAVVQDISSSIHTGAFHAKIRQLIAVRLLAALLLKRWLMALSSILQTRVSIPVPDRQ